MTTNNTETETRIIRPVTIRRLRNSGRIPEHFDKFSIQTIEGIDVVVEFRSKSRVIIEPNARDFLTNPSLMEIEIEEVNWGNRSFNLVTAVRKIGD